ncbi:putative ribonuclease H-like domain-containing protein [Tanacetum coccineum]
MHKQNVAGLITFINKQRRTRFSKLFVCLFSLSVGTKEGQGYRQEEGVDYDEVFASVARIEAIRLFLAYASFMDFIVYQMDMKSAFLYGTIEEEVYVSQPPGFVDPKFPNRVYKVEKGLYGLHQAPRAWYETLSTYLLENGFRRGITDKTLFINKIKNDILLVQVYVDDIIFGSTNKSLSTEFEQLMHKRFQMSSIGELTFFLRLQVEQRKDGIFLSLDKYVYDILKKFGFSSVKTTSTLMETHKPLSKDADGTDVDVHLYRSMIGSLMYLTSSRPDIMFAACACSRFQDSPMDLISYSDSDYAGASLDRKSTTGDKKELAIPGQTATGKESSNPLMAGSLPKIINLKFVDQHNMVACLEKTEENAEFHQIFWNTATSKTVNTIKQIHAIVDDKAVVISESFVRSDLLLDDEDGITCLTNPEIFENLALMGYEQLSTKLTFQKEPQTASIQLETPTTSTPQTEVSQVAVSQIVFHDAQIEPIIQSPTTYQRKRKTHKCRRTKKNTELPQTSVPQNLRADEVVHQEGGDSVERAITTDASLDAVHDSDNIFKTQSTAMPNVDIPQGIDTSGSPRCQDTMGGTPAQTRFERVLKQPNEPPLLEGHISRSGEGRMEHTFELMESVPPTPYDSPLPGGHIPRSDKGSLKLEELMNRCTNLSNRVLALEEAKTDQDKGRVESSTNKSLDEEDTSKQGRYQDKTKPMFKESDFDELHDDMQDAQGETIDAATTRVSTVSELVTTAGVAISIAEPRTPPTTTTVFDDKDVTMEMAQTLRKMKEQKAKEKGVAFREEEEEEETPRLTTTRSITTLQPLPAIDPKDKGKGVLVEEESNPSIKVKRSDQGDLQYDNIQAYIDADALFAAKLQQEEREQFTIEERAQILVETIAAQRKFKAAQRAAEIRSKPPTKTQIRNLMMTYLKNMGGYKYSQLKGKTYEEIHELYEK